MKARLNIGLISPAAYRAMVGLEHFTIQQSSIEPKLVHLLKMRASQINGSAFCLDMPSKDDQPQAGARALPRRGEQHS